MITTVAIIDGKRSAASAIPDIVDKANCIPNIECIIAIIHSIFGIQFALSTMSGIADAADLLPSIIATVVIIGFIYGIYFLATYFESKNIIKENT